MGLLEGMGYTKVRHYVGGMADWLEHGAAVEKSAALIEAPPVRSSARQNIRRRLSWLEILANWPLERLVGFWVEEALESLLANLVICLQSLLEINSLIVTANGQSASLAGGLKSVSGLANEICGDCVPHSYAPALKESMDQIQELARKIA